jgi:hypothetical protein
MTALDRGPHRPVGRLFLPVERATDEFEQLFGRRPSIYEVAAGVASRPDLVEPVHPSALRWLRPAVPGLTGRFLHESVGDRPRLELERAVIAGALLECLEDWEEQVMRSRVEPHMTQVEITHALAFSQLRASIALIRGLERLDAVLTTQSNDPRRDSSGVHLLLKIHGTEVERALTRPRTTRTRDAARSHAMHAHQKPDQGCDQ